MMLLKQIRRFKNGHLRRGLLKTGLLACCTAFMVSGTIAFAQGTSEDQQHDVIQSVQKIWDQSPHNAFTDLVEFHGQFYCVFREGAGHVSPDGALRVLRSSDGKTWESAALITSQDSDLRDAKIFVTPDQELCLAGAGAYHNVVDGITHQSYVWFSKDGSNWSGATAVGDPNFWLWRTIWGKDAAYAIGYNCSPKHRGIRLYRSTDGRHYETLVADLNQKGYVNEAAMTFLPDGRLLAVVRRDELPSEAIAGSSNAPYTDWKFQETKLQIGGPEMLQLQDGRIIVAGRDYVGGATTRVWFYDPETHVFDEIVKVPSSGDCSYPGLIEKDGNVWMSYYSSHEGKSNIYLAKLKIPAAESK